jgi:REP element-mobilizing transposase RayT
VLPPSGRRACFEGQLLKDAPVTLDALQRCLVLDAILRHCDVREWILHAAHVRTNHVHVVLWAGVPPEEAMAQLKRYASRSLNQASGRRRRWWARHGSTRYLWDERQIAGAVDYVVHEQGAPMALYLNGDE